MLQIDNIAPLSMCVGNEQVEWKLLKFVLSPTPNFGSSTYLQSATSPKQGQKTMYILRMRRKAFATKRKGVTHDQGPLGAPVLFTAGHK